MKGERFVTVEEMKYNFMYNKDQIFRKIKRKEKNQFDWQPSHPRFDFLQRQRN